MEVRKIIRVGERSFGITLPKEWVEWHGLRVGSPIRVLVDRDKITLLPARRRPPLDGRRSRETT